MGFYLIHKFHNLSWITEINELFHNIQIYWDAPVYIYTHTYTHVFNFFVETDFFFSGVSDEYKV